jgi:5-keto 4-deoxyuronate isomerase
MDTQALRDAFLLTDIWVASKLAPTATDVDRAVVGGILPEATGLKLAAPEELH